MPRKRRLSDEQEEDVHGGAGIKKRKRTELDDAEVAQELYETIRSHKTEEGRLLCEVFIRAPKRRTDPDYYTLVSNPMDLLKVQHKLKSDEYKSLEEFTADIELLVENSKAYYKEDSQEHQDAVELWDLFTESKTVLLGEEMPEYDGDDDDDDDEAFDDDDDDDEDSKESSKPGYSKEDMKTFETTDIVIPGTGGTPTIKLKMVTSPQMTESFDKTVPPVPEVIEQIGEDTDDNSKPPGEDMAEATNDEDDAQKEKTDSEMGDKDDRGSLVGDDEDTSYEELFAAVVMAQDGERCISEMFKILPSRKKYPDYYEVIHDPVDLKTIAQRIQCVYYKNLEDMARDLHQMVYNAKIFNEPGSQIYRDAITLKKIVTNKKHELDQQKNTKEQKKPVRSERIRTRKAHAGQRLSMVIAAIDSDSDKEEPVAPIVPAVVEVEDDSGAEEMMTDSEDDPLWTLFLAVKNVKNSLGQRLSEPFLRMPSKRIYPDYYEEIKKPMSLLKMQKKLKNAQYRDMDHLLQDFEIVFQNAKKYNIDESKLYKDAVKLQNVLRSKLKEDFWDMDTSARSGKGRRSLDAMSTTSGTSEEGSAKKKTVGRKSLSPEEALKKRLWTLFRTVFDYAFDGRPLIPIFVNLPNKKDYPDYYQVISEAIDMTMIENKIKLDKYIHEKNLIADFELLFNNARHYNEENSQVYKDAETLERILSSKVRSMPSLEAAGVTKSLGRSKPKTKSTTTLAAKLQDLYNTIRDYTDSRKRVLSTPFMKLPLKSDYPDYYEVIKRPVDMQKVFGRMMSNQYTSVEDMVSDVVLMFDNACRYNEPDSLIYKDALTLQRICLEKKAELCADDFSNDVPEVRAKVQELMTNLFISTFNHTDEESRCYSDSFMELPPKIMIDDPESSETKEKRTPTFEQVKRNLDKGRYHRLDRFQEDMFEVFEFARRVSRTDSQVYEDSIELQMFFIQIRDELCKNGEILLTPALSYTETHLNRDLEEEKHEKAPKEQREDEERKKQPEMEEERMEQDDKAGKTDTIDFQEQRYIAGEFVYIEPRDKDMDPHIVCIEKMWKEETGEQWLYGCWFLRPNETYHLATRKFLEKELFKSDFYDSVPFSKVLGKCHVMSVKDYFKMKPEDFSDKDVYICESRYSGRHKAFKKIKNWQLPKNELLRLVQREFPLSQVRVASVFADKANSEERGLDDGLMDILDKDREVVPLENVQGAEEGYTYYEQYQAHTTWVKLGDHVYVRRDPDEKPRIVGIDRIWTDPTGDTYVHGPMFSSPAEVEHPPTRLFYKRELFRSSSEYTSHVANIIGRCAVMSFKEYTTCRPTEVLEVDIFICESKYMENEKTIKKFQKPMKKHSLSVKVCDDEVYFFRKAISPHKEPSPLLLKASEEPFIPDLDGNTMDSSYSESLSYQGEIATLEARPPEPVSEKKKGKNKNKSRNVSGYIMFAAEYRKEIAAENPDMSFGEISKIVGAKWKALDKSRKEFFEDKAKCMWSEQATKQTEAYKAFNDSLNKYPPTHSPGGDNCIGSPGRPGTPGQVGGHPQQHPYGYPNYPGQLPQGGYPGPQGMTHFPPAMMGQQTPGTSQAMAPLPPTKPPEPMFVSVPPKTQRLVHSEAYLRYIENLGSDNRTVGNWDKTLSATPENTPVPSSSKLPVHWLANGAGHHETTTNALWALRDLMMKDTLTISRTLDFSEY